MASAPTLYEYYNANGISSGLSANQSYFTLNNKNITIYSGALHYFRVPPQYWRDRLRKMRAAGLNSVETYVPWNLHEPQIGKYDFGNGGTEMEPFLDIAKFLQTAQEEDLLVIVRPGPFICAEWEFGGLPSWLLREKNIKIRTSDNTFMKHVSRYFSMLLPILAAFQYLKGGPIVALQIENEYGSTETKTFKPDKKYLEALRNLMIENNINELLFTSDNPAAHGDAGTLPGLLLQTANFARGVDKEFGALNKLQQNRPTMAMEFWTGWFDHWSEKHSQRNNTEFRQVLEEILKYPASVNMYMFHGGTNWGFFNGANIPNGPEIYQPDTTSYDYDAPLSENGDYSEKYYIVKEVIEKYNTVKTKIPPMPELKDRYQYESVQIRDQLTFEQILEQLSDVFENEKVVPMELLSLNNNTGQSYGYINYHTKITSTNDGTLKFTGYLHDNILVLVNGTLISQPLKDISDLNKFGYWRLKDGTIQIPNCDNATLDIVVLNWGRNNFGRLDQFQQFKGLTNSVLLNDIELKNWEIRPLEFKQTWTKFLNGWGSFSQNNLTLNRVEFEINAVFDTYLDMREWNTGTVIVNGFVLGRYMTLGPQQALYLPAPFLAKGKNEILIFEHFIPATRVTFAKNPIFVQK